MIAVGIDISKAKSTVAVIDSDGTVLASPFTMAHTQPEMEAFVTYLKGLGEPTTILWSTLATTIIRCSRSFKTKGFPFALSIHTNRFQFCRELLPSFLLYVPHAVFVIPLLQRENQP